MPRAGRLRRFRLEGYRFGCFQQRRSDGTDIRYGVRDEFMSSIEEAMVAEAEPLGYKIVSQDAQNDSSKQIQYIETAVNGGAEAVICLPVDADGTQSLIDAVGEKNLVFVNRPPTNYSELAADNVTYVGSNEDTSGYYQGEYLANYFKQRVRRK